MKATAPKVFAVMCTQRDQVGGLVLSRNAGSLFFKDCFRVSFSVGPCWGRACSAAATEWFSQQSGVRRVILRSSVRVLRRRCFLPDLKSAAVSWHANQEKPPLQSEGALATVSGCTAQMNRSYYLGHHMSISLCLRVHSPQLRGVDVGTQFAQLISTAAVDYTGKPESIYGRPQGMDDREHFSKISTKADTITWNASFPLLLSLW